MSAADPLATSTAVANVPIVVQFDRLFVVHPDPFILKATARRNAMVDREPVTISLKRKIQTAGIAANHRGVLGRVNLRHGTHEPLMVGIVQFVIVDLSRCPFAYDIGRIAKDKVLDTSATIQSEIRKLIEAK